MHPSCPRLSEDIECSLYRGRKKLLFRSEACCKLAQRATHQDSLCYAGDDIRRSDVQDHIDTLEGFGEIACD